MGVGIVSAVSRAFVDSGVPVKSSYAAALWKSQSVVNHKGVSIILTVSHTFYDCQIKLETRLTYALAHVAAGIGHIKVSETGAVFNACS